MTQYDLRRRGTLICGHLANDVGKIAPTGIGHWARTWEVVAGPDADFMLALSNWEAEPTDATKERVRATYGAVLDAWRALIAEYERQEAEP